MPGRLFALMQATVEPLEDNRVKLTVKVDAGEFETAINAAFKKIAREVRLPGFRPGKAPRRILEAHLGTEGARQQALQDGLPGYYADAIIAENIDVIAPPELSITAGEEEGDVEFEAIVEVRPIVELNGYGSLRVTLPYTAVDEAAVDAQIKRVREQQGEWVDIARPLALDDYATLDIEEIDREPSEDEDDDEAAANTLSLNDFGYPVGSGFIMPELDENLRGTKSGETFEVAGVFNDRMGRRSGETVKLNVTVKSTQERVLPDLTDEWVDENTEYDDIASMRDQMRSRADLMARAQAQMALRDATIGTVADMVDIDAPEPLVDQEVRNRINDFAQRLSQQGATLDDYFQATGQDPNEFLEGLREQSARAVRGDLALRAVVRQEAIEASDDELEEEIIRLATRMGQKVEKVRRDLVKAGVLEAVRSDVAMGKALQFLVDNAIPVDEEGNVIDIALPEAPAADSSDAPAADEIESAPASE